MGQAFASLDQRNSLDTTNQLFNRKYQLWG